MNLKTPLKDANPLVKKYAKRLESLEIYTFEDLLYHIPFRYEDYSLISPIERLQAGEMVTVIGKVASIKSTYTKQRFKTIQKAILKDTTGSIDIIWFNQPYLAKMIHQGDTIAIAGKVEKNSHSLQFTSPEYELILSPLPNPLRPEREQKDFPLQRERSKVRGKSSSEPENQNSTPAFPNLIHTARLVPIYHETKGVTSKWLRRQVTRIFYENKAGFTEHLPYSIINKHGFLDYLQTIEQIHFPNSITNASLARNRLAFEELFYSQLTAMKRRLLWKQKLIGQPFAIQKYTQDIDKVVKSLPFNLTAAQQKAVEHIFADMQQQQPMNRLLEGDVGSGKTVVAALSMYVAYLNGYQSVLMAPTEILAQQHYNTVSKLLESFGVKVQLVTGSKKSQIPNLKSQKNKTSDIGHWDLGFDILIGTHAVLSKNINFDKLGLVVIDEQQRFGVEQRSLIRTKGTNPHFLTMTATPIPRTIALTMYGDLDLSLLDEMPKGRKVIKTWLVPDAKRKGAYQWIAKQITETASQVFIICPFIEESETMTTIKAATKEFEELQKNIFPTLKLGLLHGKMKAKEKDEVLQKFREKKFDILVATPVVEVGIDIPNATIILIEASERFGLSQLHQLRGRVGRGEKQSYCLLFTESSNPQTIARLRAMERMHIGPELAEFDLRLRGAGDIYGTVQHGQTFFKIASFADVSLIEKAKTEAEAIFPDLEKHPKLLEKLQELNSSEVSPD